MDTRVDWVDCAKAIGIILVVYGHIARALYNSGIELPVHLYKIADSIIYSFHMPLFFFLSGLFFYGSFLKRGGRQLVFNKIDTIVYPYVVWSILQGCVEALLSNYTNGNVTFNEVFSLFWKPRSQFWFLYALFFVFVASATIYSFVSERLGALIFFLAALIYLCQSILPDIRFFRLASQNIVFFFFGIIFTKYDYHNRISSPSSLAITLVAFIGAQYLFHGYLAKEYTEKGIKSLLLSLVSILFVVSLSSALSKKPNRFFVFIGASSMVIYLMHILAGSGTRIILTKIFGINSALIHLTMGFSIGVFAPLFAQEIINRVKIPYVFSAPVSKLLTFLYNETLRRTSR